jgi:hypothetical protein
MSPLPKVAPRVKRRQHCMPLRVRVNDAYIAPRASTADAEGRSLLRCGGAKGAAPLPGASSAASRHHNLTSPSRHPRQRRFVDAITIRQQPQSMRWAQRSADRKRGGVRLAAISRCSCSTADCEGRGLRRLKLHLPRSVRLSLPVPPASRAARLADSSTIRRCFGSESRHRHGRTRRCCGTLTPMPLPQLPLRGAARVPIWLSGPRLSHGTGHQHAHAAAQGASLPHTRRRP